MVEQTKGARRNVGVKRSTFRYYKKQLARKIRRLWKRLGEDAPTKRREVTHGWFD